MATLRQGGLGGPAGAGGGGDQGGAGDSASWLVSAAPLLVGGIAALLLVRLYPLPLRLFARPLARRRGAVGFLSAASAGRASAAQALPLLALLLALTTAAFGGSVLTGIADARDRTALLAVGADVRVDRADGNLPAGLAAEIRRVPGVDEVAAVHIDWYLRLPDQSTAPLIAVDPAVYARLTRTTSLGPLREDELAAPEGELAGPGGGSVTPAGELVDPEGGSAEPAGRAAAPTGGSATRAGGATAPAGESVTPAGDLTTPAGRAATPAGRAATPAGRATAPAGRAATPAGRAAAPGGRRATLPAVASPDVARRLGEGPHTFRTPTGTFKAAVGAVRDGTPALPAGSAFLLIDRRVLDRPEDTALLATGASGQRIDAAALTRSARAAGADVDATFRAAERASLTDSPIQSGAERIYAAAVAAGAGYAVLAVLLALLHSAPQRAALLARLRTIGLSRGQGRRLLVLESLPQALLAAGGGVLSAVAAITLLAPGVDLAHVALAARGRLAELGDVTLRADPWSLLLPAVGVVVLAGRFRTGVVDRAAHGRDRAEDRRHRMTARTPSMDTMSSSLAELEARATAHRDRPAYGHDALITCDRLVRVFSTDGVEVQALQGLDLLVREGELMALVGASGSGKSTLMNILAGLDEPTAGAARVAGRDLLAMGAKERLGYRRDVVGFVWQQTARNLLPYLTAAQNVALPMQLKGGARGRRRATRALRAERAAQLLELMAVSDVRDRRPHQLSGGQQQRVAIAVALANNPSVLLADEPTGELDSHTAEQIFAAFRTANEELGTTIVVVTHDQAVASEVRRTVAIRDGRTSTEVLRRTEVDASTGQESVTSREYAMLDRAGRLQLPAEYTAALDMRDRVALELERDHIGVWPDDRQAGDADARRVRDADDRADGTGDADR